MLLVGASVAGKYAGVEVWRRSKHGFDGRSAMGHNESSRGDTRVPGSTGGAVTRSNASTSDCGCDSDMDGGQKVTAPAIGVARVSKTRGERGESKRSSQWRRR